jgi:hypothetical protein
MTLLQQLQDELSSLVRSEYSFGGPDFPVDAMLDDGQSVEWVSSCFIDGLLENIYCVSAPNEPTVYISSSHSDGGVVVFHGGPWNSLDEAKSAHESGDEEWLDF